MNLFKKLFVFGNFVIFTLSLLALVALACVAALMSLPDVAQLERCMTTAMYQVHLCPQGENYVKLKEISPYVLHAVIAAEDGSFYSHKGFDWHEMKESINADLASGKFHRGGSTLTQQLAKNVFLNQEKSVWRKLKEAYLANAIENRYGKDFILEKYLNVVEFGDQLYGVKGAAQTYFHKAPSQLHPLEAAWLAMLLPNPKKYSQSYRNGSLTPFARKMVMTILKRMESFGKLSAANYQLAVNNVGSFPWSQLSLSSFAGSGDYSLESDRVLPPENRSDEPIDEDSLESVLREDGATQEPPPPDTAPPAPEGEPEGQSPQDFE